jgi:hypothetical protein
LFLVSCDVLDVPFPASKQEGALSTSKLLVGTLGIFVLACGPNRHGNGGDANGSGGGDAPACASSMTKADQIPLDLFIMLDQSGSMQGNKWDSVTTALKAFVQQPSLAGVSVGMQYFAVPAAANSCTVALCTSDAQCGAGCGPCVIPIPGLPGGCTGFHPGGDSCNANDYAVAAVEIAPLPGVANSIITSIGQHSPNTGTPTSAALQGAINHSKAWGTAHPNDAVVVILATDGDPEDCDTSLPHIDAIAAAGLAGTPKILTFVIGVGSSLQNLNGIAAAGGSMSAFLVDTGGNVQQQFLDAMNNIRHAALGCTYAIPSPPDGSAPDYNLVNVVYKPGNGGPAQTIPRVNSKADCPMSGNAWYYDDPAHPMRIELCDPTCSAIEVDTTGEIDVQLGCSTVIF